jgi:quinohemoprotein ethanol dehydrogenase
MVTRLGTKGAVGAAILVLLAAIAAGGCGGGPKASTAPADRDLTAGAGENWPTVGGDVANTRFSSLTQITPTNVSKLHLVWQGTYGAPITPAGFNGGAAIEVEGAPLVFDGVMYLATPQGDVVSIDATNGKQNWRWRSNVKPGANLTAFNTAQRGVALGGGNVYVETSSGRLVAIDATSGQLRWQQPVALPGTGLESPAVPVYYHGVVYVGVSGKEAARGHLDAFDANTGKRMWRTFLVCSPADTPPASGQCRGDLPANSGGGSVWMWPALDPSLGLAYATTANPSANTGTPGDDRWATSIVAISMKNGRIAWGFQGVHHDIWDYDCLTPPVLFSAHFGGQAKNGVEYTCKSDYHFELDRATGKPLLPVKEVPVPTDETGKTPDLAAQKHFAASPTQPIPAGKSEVVPHCASPALLPDPAPDGTKYIYSCTYAAPGSKRFTAWGISKLGGQDWTPLSYNPKLGYVYYCEKVSVEGAKIGSVREGGTFTGVTKGWVGSVAAVNVENNNLVWRFKQMAPGGSCYGGSAATSSGLVFASANKGMLYAFDARTGAKLWSYKAPEYVAAPPIVYSAGGNEYVAYYVGGQTTVTGGMTTPHEDRLMVFSVDAVATPSAKGNPKPAPGALPSTPTTTKPSTPQPTTAGAAIFRANCSSCHTLAAAGANGTTGPDLDTLKPSAAVVRNIVTNGGGPMPAFGRDHILSSSQIKSVAAYVSQAAGRKR